MRNKKENAFHTRYGPWALITGASSGIGLALAGEVAKRGVNVVLVARRLPQLNAAAADIGRRHAVATRTLAVDLSELTAAQTVAAATDDLDIGLLINNAGYSLTGPLLDADLAAQQRMLRLNTATPLALAHHFGRPLRSRGHGGIIFVASIVAYSPTPGWANYAAGKAYLRHLSLALAHELPAVDVLLALPGETRTGFGSRARIGTTPLALTPERVARQTIRALGRRTTVTPGILNRLMTFLAPRTPQALTTRIAALYLTHLQKR